MAGKVKTTLQMFGIAFMVYKNEMFGIPIYAVGFVLLGARGYNDDLVDDHLSAGRLAVHYSTGGDQEG